jgi:hypothetical protein
MLACLFVVRYKTIGILKDVDIYKQFFDYSEVIVYNETPSRSQYDVIFSIEFPFGTFMKYGHKNILMVNYEYILAKSHLSGTLDGLRQTDYIICKTRFTVDYMNWVRAKYDMNYTLVYTMHTSPIVSIKLKDRETTMWLHAPGKSVYKGTYDIITCWKDNPNFPPLVLICRDILYNNIKDKIAHLSNVLHTKYVEDLDKLQAYHLNHICLSAVEGYGHYINEARGHSAFVVTTDYPPMNELINDDCGYLIKPNVTHISKVSDNVNYMYFNKGTLDREFIEIFKIPISERIRRGKNARKEYLKSDRFFRNAMDKFLSKL